MALKETLGVVGYQQITVLTSSTALTMPASGVSPTFCYLQAETQNVRWRDDGTAPTASVGMILYAGDPPVLYDGDLSTVRFIEVTASAKLNVSYYR